MTEKTIEITTPDGVVDGYLYSSDEETPNPGVIHYTDIFGIREANRGMASRLAEEGFTVLLPNVFFRTGKPPIMSRSDPEEVIKKRFGELRTSLTPEAMTVDSGFYAEYLTGLDSVANGPIGVVGYCFTGGMAMRTAAVRPDIVTAAASFHGGGLYTDDASSPHLVLPDIKAKLYFGHAYEDGSMPAEAISNLDEALEAWGGNFKSRVFREAGHGWTVPGGPAYNHSAAEEAFADLSGLLESTLRS